METEPAQPSLGRAVFEGVLAAVVAAVASHFAQELVTGNPNPIISASIASAIAVVVIVTRGSKKREG